jgi:hypothetical protein
MSFNNNSSIINGLCYINGNIIVCIDLYTETPKKYSIETFRSFIKDNDVNEQCIILVNIENDSITPLYKYKLEGKDTNTPIYAKTKSVDVLVSTCYDICIEINKLF